MENKAVRQALVVTATRPNNNLPLDRICLFNPDGTPYEPAQSQASMFDSTALLAKAETLALDGSEYLTVYDPVDNAFYRVKPDALVNVPSALNTRLSAAESAIASFNTKGGLVYNSEVTRQVTNTTTETYLARCPTDATIPYVQGDRHLFSVQGTVSNTTGVTRNLSLRIRINNVLVHQINLVPISSLADGVRIFQVEFFMIVGSSTSNHIQRTFWDLSDPLSGTSGDGNGGSSAAGFHFVSAATFPKKLANRSSTVDITSTLKNTDVRFEWSFADPGLIVNHVASDYTIQKAS